MDFKIKYQIGFGFE